MENLMNPSDPTPPWQHLEQLVEAADAHEVESYLDSLPAGETARVLSRLSPEDQSQLLQTLPPDEAAEVIEQLSEVQAADLLEDLPAETAAQILEELPSDQQADIVGDLDKHQAEQILTEMEPEAATELRSLVQYPDDVAGGLMITEFLAYPRDFTVAQVIDDLRANAEEYRDYQVQYAYVTGAAEELVGVLRLRDLLLAKATQPIERLMIEKPVTVSDTTSLDDLRDFFDRHHYLGVPVVDAGSKFLGVLRRTAVEEALADRNADDYRKTQGIIREEFRTMPLFVRSRRRLAWLSVNIGLNVIAASVIAFYQDTLAKVIALAVFLPIISDMSGCSGNQAVAVSMRELALGLIRPNEVWRVWLKEVSVGLINGLALGLLIATVASLWQGNPWLGLVVGTALAMNTMIAVSIGGTLPLVMRRLKMDPALASGPVLTTVTDMCGFFLVLSLAAALLPRLTG
jgi:magnesium transporter